MSTAEPTNEEGMSKNPTKSPCGQYVFNTAITRAKSLVVCVGNPFLLLKVEQKMKNEQNFWRDYMKRCIIAKTFHVHDSSLAGKSITEVYRNLQIEIFTDYSSDYVQDEEGATNDDPIINRLQDIIRQRPHYQRCKLQIYNQQQNDQIWKIAETTGERNPDEQRKLVFIEKVNCELVTTTRRIAHGFPLDTKQEPIAINGFKNRRGAFNGDIVTVGVLGKHLTTGKRYGKVVDLIEARHAMKYVCTADSQNIINFYPLDKTEPAIVNLPKLSRYVLQCKRNADDDSPTTSSHITVFKESSLNLRSNSDILPAVKELVPLEMAPSLLFVVKVFSWAPEYWKPLGAVISAIPRTNSMFIMERLLRITYNIQQDEDNQPTDSELIASNNPAPLLESVPLNESAPAPAPAPGSSESALQSSTVFGFTIDSEDSINLDDALSITRQSENCWKMSVLITDVTQVIQKDSKLDKRAKQRGTSVYGLRSPQHMLPVNLTKAKLSLLPNQQRDAIAISALVKIEKGAVEVEDEYKIENVPMKSLIRLTYGEAQQIIIKETTNHEILQNKREKFSSCSSSTSNMTLDESLILLYKAAMRLCVKRIGNAAYYSDVTDHPGDENNWHSCLLVSELMIWANSKIAEFVYKNVPNCAILRKQLSPLPEDIDLLKEVHKDALDYSMSLKSISSTSANDSSSRRNSPQLQQQQPLLIPLCVWERLRDAYRHIDVGKLRNLLAEENHYPQLAIASIALRSISRKAEYVKSQPPIVETDDEGNVIETQSPYYHHGLKLNAYTHFTSPIRRYPDIVMQRFVSAILHESDILYTEGELQKLCTHLNHRLKSASKFEVDVKKIQFATRFEESLDQVEAYLSKSLYKLHKFELHIPSAKYKGIIRGVDTHFDQSKLNCLKPSEESCITWRVILVPFKPPNYLFDAIKFSKFTKSFDQVTSSAGTIKANVFSYEKNETNMESSAVDKRLKKHLYISKLAEDTVKLDKDEWELCNTFVKRCSLMEQDNLHDYIEDLRPLFIHQHSDPTHDDIEEVPAILESPVVCLDVSRNFDIGETVNVWMGRNIAKPIPSPGVDLIEVAPSVKVCLRHNKSPAMCFSDTRLQLTSRHSYRSVEEYFDLWSKALLAEASYDAVNTNSIVLLTDVPLVWPSLERPDNCLDNVYFKPKGDLKLELDKKQLNLLEFVFKVKVLAGDLVCARYSAQQQPQPPTTAEHHSDSPQSHTSSAIYHFVIHKVETIDEEDTAVQEKGKKETPETVSMRPVGDHGCRVSIKWRDIITHAPGRAPLCELQIIKMPVSFKLVCMK